MRIFLKNFIMILNRYKQFCFLSILGLSIAFAAFIIIIIQLKYDWGYDKFYKKADRIYRLEIKNQESNLSFVSRSFAEAVFRSSPHIMEGGSIFKWSVEKLIFTITRNGESFPYKEEWTDVSPSFLNLFEFRLAEGILNCSDNGQNLIIPQSMANKLFGKSSAIGQKLLIQESDPKILTIGGVYHDFPQNSTVKNIIYMVLPSDELNSWGKGYNAYLLLDSPESKKIVEDSFLTNPLSNTFSDESISPKIELIKLSDVYFNPQLNGENWSGEIEKGNKQTMILLLGLAILISAIAGINFTNFSTALTPMRVKSINTQKVLGCSDAFLRLSLLVEAVLISILSFLFALMLVSIASGTILSDLLVANISLGANIDVVWAIGLFSLFVGLLAGAYPAYYITSFSPALVLKGSFGLSPKGRYLRNVLTIIQFSTAIGLIIVSLFFYLQNRFIKSSLGFDKDRIAIVELSNTAMKAQNVLVDKLKSFPEIENIAFAEQIISSKDMYMKFSGNNQGQFIEFTCIPVSSSFLEVMEIPLLEGRNFREEDQSSKNGVYIFNEKAHRSFNMHLGAKLNLNQNIADGEIIGFMPDIKFTSLRSEVSPMALYIWGTENWGSRLRFSYIKIKAGSNVRDVINHIHTTLTEIDPNYSFEIVFFDEVLNNLYKKEHRTSSMVNLLALLAVLLAVIGVFGLVEFESQYRKKEIGIRKVYGDSTANLLIRFNMIYFYLLLVCFIIASPLAYIGIKRWMSNFAYHVPLYWWVFFLSFIIVLMITGISISLRSWQAANQNPVDSLKNDE